MSRSSNSFQRREPRYRQQPTTLVVCEDSKSGLQYVKDACKNFRVDVKVEVAHCGNTDPKGIVEYALSRQNDFDRVYCMIDRDAHENFDEAVELAKTSSKVETIVSYPCFEFWLLLHFGYSRKPYVRAGKHSPAECLIRDLRKFPEMKDYDKGKVKKLFDSLCAKFETARGRSEKALVAAKEEGQFNPSTQLHELMDSFKDLSEPQLISTETGAPKK